MLGASRPGPGEPGYEHERPALTTEACKPDVLDRLRSVRALYPTHVMVDEAAEAAIAAIKYLRDANDRLIADERTRKAEVEQLRAALRDVAGGQITGASTLVLAGDWKGFATALQTKAREAVAQRVTSGPEAPHG